jgi:hypothetical protein
VSEPHTCGVANGGVDIVGGSYDMRVEGGGWHVLCPHKSSVHGLAWSREEP